MGVKICPDCGGKVSDSRNECIHCGYIFSSKKECPDCLESIDSNLSTCPICGYYFEQNEKNNDKEQPKIKQNEIVEDIKVNEVIETEVSSTGDIEENKQEKLTCPYCGCQEHMEIGIDYYLCTLCKGKFLNISSKYSNISTSIPTIRTVKNSEEAKITDVKDVTEKVDEIVPNVKAKVVEEQLNKKSSKKKVKDVTGKVDEIVPNVKAEVVEEQLNKKSSKKKVKEKKKRNIKKLLIISLSSFFGTAAIVFGILLPTVIIPTATSDFYFYEDFCPQLLSAA